MTLRLWKKKPKAYCAQSNCPEIWDRLRNVCPLPNTKSIATNKKSSSAWPACSLLALMTWSKSSRRRPDKLRLLSVFALLKRNKRFKWNLLRSRCSLKSLQLLLKFLHQTPPSPIMPKRSFLLLTKSTTAWCHSPTVPIASTQSRICRQSTRRLKKPGLIISKSLWKKK